MSVNVTFHRMYFFIARDVSFSLSGGRIFVHGIKTQCIIREDIGAAVCNANMCAHDKI
jgi:hypothetical protein